MAFFLSLSAKAKHLFAGPGRTFLGLIGGFGVLIALFLLFRSSSDLRTLNLPPWRIIRWIDRHGELRNAPAFAILALPFLLLARGRAQRRKVILGLALFVAVTEFGQLAIKTRTFDLNDIFLGWLGLALSWALVEFASWCLCGPLILMRNASPKPEADNICSSP